MNHAPNVSDGFDVRRDFEVDFGVDAPARQDPREQDKGRRQDQNPRINDPAEQVVPRLAQVAPGEVGSIVEPTRARLSEVVRKTN